MHSSMFDMVARAWFLVAALPLLTSQRYDLDGYQNASKAGQETLWEPKFERSSTTCEDYFEKQLRGSSPDEPNESRTLIEGCYVRKEFEVTIPSLDDSGPSECKRLEWTILVEGWIGTVRSGAEWIGTILML